MNGAKLDFVFYGGRPCLDLYNTIRRRKDSLTDSQDLLRNENAFKKWVFEAKKKSDWSSLLPPLSPCGMDSKVSNHLKEQALLLREIIGRLLDKSYTPKDIETINQFSKLRPTWALSLNHELLSAQANLELEAVLGLIAEDAVQLFSLEISKRIKECAHERCGIVFLDKSRGNNRSWCSMKECGNRAKVARFAQNQNV